MSPTPKPSPPGPEEPAVRNYMIVCGAALALVALALWQRGLGVWSLFPPLVGLVVLLLRWRIGPPLFLLSVAAELYLAWLGQAASVPWRPPRWSPLADVVLCAAVLAYLACSYRLQGLVKFLFPRDPRRPASAARPAGPQPPRGPLPLPPQQRSPGLVTPAELALLLVSLPLWAGLALLAYRWLVPAADEPGQFDTENAFYSAGWLETIVLLGQMFLNAVWHFRLLVWCFGVGLVAVLALLGYVARGRMTPAEAALVLQEEVWQQTRGEERRIQSWRVWARLRREGKP